MCKRTRHSYGLLKYWTDYCVDCCFNVMYSTQGLLMINTSLVWLSKKVTEKSSLVNFILSHHDCFHILFLLHLCWVESKRSALYKYLLLLLSFVNEAHSWVVIPESRTHYCTSGSSTWNTRGCVHRLQWVKKYKNSIYSSWYVYSSAYIKVCRWHTV